MKTKDAVYYAKFEYQNKKQIKNKENKMIITIIIMIIRSHQKFAYIHDMRTYAQEALIKTLES